MYIKLLTLVMRLVYARLHASIVFLFVFTYFEQLADSKSALRPTTETLSCFIRFKFLQAVNLFKSRLDKYQKDMCVYSYASQSIILQIRVRL